MKINFDNETNKVLIEMLRESYKNENYELECIIGNQSHMSRNTHQDLVSIIQRVKDKKPFTNYKVHDSLVINMNKTKYKNVISRIIINGLNSINTYCATEKLSSVMNSVVFEKKTKVNNIQSLQINDFDLKFNMKEEKSLDKNSAVIGDILSNWSSLLKSFRRKKTFSFTHDESDFKLDLSIVTQHNYEKVSVNYVNKNKLLKKVIPENKPNETFSQWWYNVSKNPENIVKIEDYDNYYTTLKESRILENKDYRYEFEIELIDKQKNEYAKNIISNKNESLEEHILKLSNNFTKLITIIIQCKQNSFFIIPKTEKFKVVSEFLNLTKCRHVTQFFPLAIDLNMKNIKKLRLEEYSTNKEPNIRADYFVTDKADGERNLLFISKSGKCYLIDRQKNISYTGLVMNDMKSSIYDGEFINRTLDNKLVQKLYIFDAYIVNGKNITNNHFGLDKDLNGRHFQIHKLISNFANSENNFVEDDNFSLSLYKKTYYRSDLSKNMKNDTTIFESCQKILKQCNKKYGGLLEKGHMFPYPLDGLIFQPINLAVGQDYPGQDISYIGKRWEANFKWKPLNHNTIDFKVKFTNQSQNKRLINYINNMKYIEGTIFTKCYNNEESRRNLAFKLLNNGDDFRLYSEDYPFIPLNPFEGEISSSDLLKDYTSTINIPFDKNNAIRCENGDIVEDNTTIECRYDKDALPELRWIAIRNRQNKIPNAINTSFTTWELINNPITTDMITTGENIIMDSDIFYYKQGGEYLSDPMKKFNNYVKRELIDRALSNKIKPRVIDLACGKMGDMSKYVSNRVDVLVGMDISSDNLFNKFNGAAVRLLGIGRKNIPIEQQNMIKKTILLQGNATKNMSTGAAYSNILSKYYSDIIYGNIKPDSHGKLAKMYNIATRQFHLAVCNFAIHYMMNNEQDLHQFLNNIQENVTDQGYFVITFLDGREIMKKLGKKEKLEGFENDKLIWSIEKPDDFEPDLNESPYGQRIVSYLETFYQPMEENLVDIKFLEEKCKNYDLQLIDSKLFLEEPDSMFNHFSTHNPDAYENVEKYDVLKDWLHFHRWAIFQKVN